MQHLVRLSHHCDKRAWDLRVGTRARSRVGIEPTGAHQSGMGEAYWLLELLVPSHVHIRLDLAGYRTIRVNGS